MRRWISLILLVVFFSWIVPIGVFIAPSKEKLLCDGQRAICLCSHSGGSFSASQYDLAALFIDENSRSLLYLSRAQSFYQLLVCRSIDHVPKA
jgi:hypothetical protein